SPSVAIGVVRQSKANLIDVARNIRKEHPAIQQTLPLGVTLHSAYDGSVFVTHSINDARLTLLIAAILVVLIIFVFLRNVRATIIPGLAIPASIIATFAIMYFLGFSINNFTLLALTIAPMLCAKILRMQHQHGKVFQMFESGFNALSERYTQLLRKAIDHRKWVFWGTIGGVALTVFFLFGWPPARLPLVGRLPILT